MQDKIRDLREWFDQRRPRPIGSPTSKRACVASPGSEAHKLLEQTRQIPATDQPFLPGSRTVTLKMVLAMPR